MEKWDEIIIGTECMKNMISEVINKALRKKLEHNVDIQLNELAVTDENDKLHVHLNVDAEISMDELKELLKSFNVI
ncbi:MAG: CTP synthase [Lachnospiraceae bacterium]|nr:CTP synthase [Lachnospiraceae bacterium]MBD5499525.1 CTP synthase [Lachnospiraceae bacterium]